MQKVTGQVLPLNATLLTPLNLIPAVLLLIALPMLFCAIEPSQTDAQVANLRATEEPEKAEQPKGPVTLARRLEESCVLNVVMVAAGIIALGCIWRQAGFSLDLNSVIFLFLIAGLLLHWRPIAYIQAVNRAVRVTGPLILQYPLYGGIMGILISTGLADVVAKASIQFADAHTLPFWALPVVAVAGISIRRVMGFTVMSFLLGTVLFGAALLILA